MIMRTKNSCTLFNRSSVGYLIVEVASIEHLEALKSGYEYRGPAYVANITEIETMAKANREFIKNLKQSI